MAVSRQYHPILKTACVAAGAAGAPGAFLPGLDMTAVAGTWAGMIVAIARKSGHSVDKSLALKLAKSVGLGLAGYVTGSRIFTLALLVVPGVGPFATMGINGALNALYTWRLGNALIKLLEDPEFARLSLGDVAKMGAAVKALVSPLPVPSLAELAELRELLFG